MSYSKIRLSILLTIGILLSTSFPVPAQNLPQGVSIHLLDNGMQVLLIENPALPMVGVNVVVKVGSAYETFASSGMSHMLEHLLFNGTTGRTQKELYDDVDRIGGYNNANTSEYYTNFMMVTPAENIRKGMEIQADMLFHSTLPEKKFAKEKGIVLEEISKTLSDPDEQADRNIISLLYKGHALSLPTLGTYSTIEHMNRDEVFEFYKNNYVPNNMLMSVVGNFNSARMLKTVNEIYGVEAPGEVLREDNPQWAVGFEEAPGNPEEAGKVFHRFYSGNKDLLQLFFPIPKNKSSAFYALLDIKLNENNKILRSALEHNFGKDAISSSMQTRVSPISAFVSVQLVLNKKTPVSKLATLVKKELAKVRWDFTADLLKTEVSKARTSFLKNIEKPHMFGIYNAHEFAVNGIEGVLASYGSESYIDAWQELASFKINASPLIIFQHPEQQAEKTKSVASALPQLIKGDDDSPALIVRQNAVSPLLAIHYLLKHKAPLEAEYGKDAAKILHDCFEQRLKSDQNQKQSSAFGLSVKANDNPYFPMDDRYTQPDFGYIRIEALADDIPAVISFLNTQMLHFTPSEKEYERAAKKAGQPNSMMMRGRGDKAKKIFNKIYRNLVYEENPYQPADKIPSYEELLKFSKRYFTPANMVISIVSPAAPQTVKNLFAKFSAKAETDHSPVYAQRIRLQHKPKEIEKAGGGSRSYLFWGFSKKIDPADKAALKALSLLIGDKIIFDIREKQGMAYHMNAGIELTKDRSLFYISQGTRPQNVDKLVPQYPGFFDIKMLDDITEADLKKALNMYLGRMMFLRLSSINQGYYLGTSLYFHNDIQYDSNFLNQLKKVTLKDVLSVAKKYMIPENPVSIIVR